MSYATNGLKLSRMTISATFYWAYIIIIFIPSHLVYLEIYGPYDQGSKAVLPQDIAKILVSKGNAKFT